MCEILYLVSPTLIGKVGVKENHGFFFHLPELILDPRGVHCILSLRTTCVHDPS